MTYLLQRHLFQLSNTTNYILHTAPAISIDLRGIDLLKNLIVVRLFTNRWCFYVKMEDIAKMLKKIQDDMKQQKEDITKSINDNINEKFKNLEIRHADLENRIEKQDKVIQHFNRVLRQRNLIFFGVEEVEHSYEDLEKIILGIINENLSVTCNTNNVEFVKRLGKKSPDKIRPVVITFTTMGKKIQVLKKKKSLNSLPYYIKEDFPPEVLAKRKELQKQVDEEREQGRKAFLKYDKIIFRSDSPKQSKNYAKRTIDSPENINKPHPAKKNKVDLKKFVTRKPRPVQSRAENCSETE